jgi:hypothetical protein
MNLHKTLSNIEQDVAHYYGGATTINSTALSVLYRAANVLAQTGTPAQQAVARVVLTHLRTLDSQVWSWYSDTTIESSNQGEREITEAEADGYSAEGESCK